MKEPRIHHWNLPLGNYTIRLIIECPDEKHDMEAFDAVQEVLAISRRSFERCRAAKFTPLAFVPSLPIL